MRRGFDSLSGIVSSELHNNVLSGDIFVFMNRRKTQIKLLLWEGDGFALYHKRLERGTYELPQASMLTSQQLSLLLQGVILKSVRHRKRYQHTLQASG